MQTNIGRIKELSEEATRLFYKVERILDEIIPVEQRDFAYVFRLKGK